ncbi:MAG: hypothetical protein JSR33_01830 [Proteobacteria bacterium]|nr:hypothetical protein [Pseudomonadota bacterium]
MAESSSNKLLRKQVIERIMSEIHINNEMLVEKAFVDAHIPEHQWKNIAGGTAPIPQSLLKNLENMKESGKF